MKKPDSNGITSDYSSWLQTMGFFETFRITSANFSLNFDLILKHVILSGRNKWAISQADKKRQAREEKS